MGRQHPGSTQAAPRITQDHPGSSPASRERKAALTPNPERGEAGAAFRLLGGMANVLPITKYGQFAGLNFSYAFHK